MSKSKNQKFKVEVGVLMTDAQDGSYSMEMFPSYEEAKAAKQEKADDSGHEFDDDFETGHLSKETLEFELIDGKLVLSEMLFLNTDG